MTSGFLITRMIAAFTVVPSAVRRQRLRYDAVAMQHRSLQDALQGLSMKFACIAEERRFLLTL